MRRRMYERWVGVLVGVVFVFVPGHVLAKDGWYMGMDLGVAIAPEMDTASSDNDYPTTCDQFFGSTKSPDDCSTGEKWSNKFGGGTGMLAGLALGYRWGNFRAEWEYFHRNTIYEDASEPRFPGGPDEKIEQEISVSEEAIDDVSSHNFFVNLYYDFTSKSRWTPYLGVGVGLSQVSLDYSSRFARSSNPGDISTFDNEGFDQDKLDSLKGNLAGTTTIGRGNLSEALFGYQAIAGLDYRISEPFSVGLKLRWAGFSEFEDSDEYAQLRSHDSTNSLNPDDPRSARVRYSFTTDDLDFWGVSLNFKYQF